MHMKFIKITNINKKFVFVIFLFFIILFKYYT